MKIFINRHKIELTVIKKGGLPMITGQLERAFQLSKKHRLEVQTVLDLQRIIKKELNSTPYVEEKVLQQIITILENNKDKGLIREAT